MNKMANDYIGTQVEYYICLLYPRIQFITLAVLLFLITKVFSSLILARYAPISADTALGFSIGIADPGR